MEKNPDIIYPEDYLDICKKIKEAGCIDLAEMILLGRTFTGMNITQERYDKYISDALEIIMEIEFPTKEAVYEIMDHDDGTIFFEGSKLQCGAWLFHSYVNRKIYGDFRIELVAEPEEEAEEPEFQLPEHCRKQMISWKTHEEIRKLIKKHNSGAEYGHRLIMQSFKKP